MNRFNWGGNKSLPEFSFSSKNVKKDGTVSSPDKTGEGSRTQRTIVDNAEAGPDSLQNRRFPDESEKFVEFDFWKLEFC